MHPFLLLVNGKLVREETIDPAWSVAHFLREKLHLTGTKVGCGQGGCGSCTIFVSRYHKEADIFRHYSLNSCITPIASLHGCYVTTVEHLSEGNGKSCHVLQNAIAKGNGTQCGFCTPGMVMSMYSAVQTDPDLSIEKVKKAIQGNLCRCTGYRPILQSFQNCPLNGSASDIEDIGRVHEESIEASRNIMYTHGKSEISRIENAIKTLLKEKPHSFEKVEFQGPKVHWLRPTSLIELSTCLRMHPEAELVSGCTSEDFHPNQVFLKKTVIVQINWLKDLHSFEVYDNHVCIGGGMTIADVKLNLHAAAADLPEWKTRSIRSILCILQRFGSPQIRNSATIGGCLTVKSSASDLQTLANALEFSALCFNPISQAHTELNAAFPASFSKCVIVNVKIPFTKANEYTWAYKLSRRRFFDGAILNIASKTRVIPTDGNEDAKISRINLAFGGTAIKRFSLLFTYGTNPQDLNSELYLQIVNEIKQEIEQHLNTEMYSLTYISALATNLFKKLYEFLHDDIHPSIGSVHLDRDELALKTFKATQTLETKVEGQEPTDLVWRSVPHASALKHATGEAVYCDDIPKFENELVLELVLSERANAVLRKVDATNSLKLDGVKGYISHEDLDPIRNKFGIVFKDEEIFASQHVLFVGQIIGAIVAKDKFIARKAVKLVHVEYYDLPNRILTIDDAIRHKSYFDGFGTNLKVGDCDTVLESCPHSLGDEVKLGGQAHFYMEPQVAIAMPKGEDGEMEIVAAIQNPADTQEAVAHALGLNANQVTVRVKRVGGGFGGKDSRSMLVVLPAAIAAQKYGVPVRCVLDRKTDMMISGKREPFLAKYQIGFDSEGKLLAVKMNIYANAGNSLDTSAVPIERAVVNLDNAYNISNLDIEGIPCKTHRPSNTVFRGPGTVQGSHFIENILDRIASFLNKDPVHVRQINMYKEGDVTPYGQILEDCTVRQCWDECIASSQYEERKSEAELYNSTHLYRKRGIYLTPCHFGVGYIHILLNQAGALVNIYRDGSVSLNHGGVELGQGIHSKMIQVATRELGIPANKIRVVDTSTDKVPNPSPTSASLSSDMNGMALANACIILKGRLEPYTKIVPKLSWEQVVKRAYVDRVNLSAVGFYKTPNLSWNPETKHGSPFTYFVGGASCSEVEVDCLTGEYQILRTDIVMDVGKSLNPSIDIGQIEGAFMQGVGLFTLEEMVTDSNGNLQTNGTSTYKIPTALDIPLEFNVTFLKGSSNPRAIYSSKTVGEPPLILANSVYFAIKDAVRKFRKQLGLDTKFQMDSPATVEKVLEACNDMYEPLIV